MSATDATWIDAISRLTGCGVLVLDAQGTPLAADAAALARLGCDSLEGLRGKWPAGAAPRESKPAAPAASTLTMPGVGDVRLNAIALAGEGGNRLVLLDAGDNKRDDGDVIFAFARKLGHDLRGPLNAMVLNLDLLRTYLDMDIEEEERITKLRKYMASLHREVGRLNELLTAALDRARA